MKRFLLLLLILADLHANSQVYNNEWINYSQTYYKFKVGATGLYRISQPALSSIGLGSTPAELFKLWRNGKEIPVYTTVATGSMGESDYIEFWGEMNDGKPDLPLYRLPDFQLDDKWSIETDTAFYFLTVTSSASNLRYQPTANNVALNILPVEPYFMRSVGTQWRQKTNNGFAESVGSLVYSSAFDQGEGWTSLDIFNSGTPLTDNQLNLMVYTGPG